MKLHLLIRSPANRYVCRHDKSTNATRSLQMSASANCLFIIAGVAITSGLLYAAELNSVGTSEQRTGAITNRTNQPAPARSLVKEWKVNELVPVVNSGLKGGRNFERGKKLYGEATCALCHHFGPDGGGVGPDLTGVSGSFSVRDLLEAIIEPSKQISSLYATTNIRKKDGETLTGWIPEETDDTISVMESMFGEGKLTVVKRRDIETMMPSATSLMPEGLLNTLKADEILDLAAFLLSGGDSTQKMFR